MEQHNEITVASLQASHPRAEHRRQAVLQDLEKNDADMDNLRKERILLKRRLNSFTHIATLPIEVLQSIFVLCLCSHKRRTGEAPFLCLDCAATETPCELVLTQVCHAWRNTAIGFSPLWTISILTHSQAQWSNLQDLEPYTREIQIPRSGSALVVVEADLRDVPSSVAEIWLRASAVQRLDRVEELVLSHWSGKLEEAFEGSDVPFPAPLALRRFEISGGCGLGRDESNIHLPFILGRPCPSLKTLAIRDLSTQRITPSMFPALRELTIDVHSRILAHVNLNTVATLLAGLPTLESIHISQSHSGEAYLVPYTHEGPVHLPLLRSLTLANFFVLLLGHLVFPSSAAISLNCCEGVVSGHTEVQDHQLLASRLAAHFAEMTCHSVTPLDIRRLCLVRSSTGRGGRRRIKLGGKLVDITAYDHILQEDTQDPEVKLEVADIPVLWKIVDTVLSICKNMPLTGVRQLHVEAVGHLKKCHWMTLMEYMPSLESLHLQGHESARDLVAALTNDAPVQHPPLSALKRLTVVLDDKECWWEARLDVPWSYPEETDAWINKVVAALKQRKEQGFMLEELKLDLKSRSNSFRPRLLSGEYSAKDFAQLAPLVGHLLLCLPEAKQEGKTA